MKLRYILPNKFYLFIYLGVMLIAGLLFSPSHFSTDMLSIFPQNSYTKQLEDASQLQTLNRLLVISKGSDSVSKERLETIAAELQTLEGVDTLFFKVNSMHSPTAAYLRKHYAERLDLNSSRTAPAYIETRLKRLYNEMQSSFLFSGLNTSDPLELFSDPMQRKNAPSKNGIVLFNGEDFPSVVQFKKECISVFVTIFY